MAGEGVVTVRGVLGKDAELKLTPNGVQVTSFSIANTPSTKKGESWEDGETMWLSCNVWNKNALGASTLLKGQVVVVTGRLSQRTWQDKEGANRVQLVVDVDNYGITPKNNAGVSVGNKVSDSEPPWS